MEMSGVWELLCTTCRQMLLFMMVSSEGFRECDSCVLLTPQTFCNCTLVPPLVLSAPLNIFCFLVCQYYTPAEQLPVWHDSCETFGYFGQMGIGYLSQIAACLG